MGLSNPERLRNIYYAVSSLTKLATELRSHFDDYEDGEIYKEIYDRLNKLWPALLNTKGNNSLWLFGSNTQDLPSFESGDVWSVAIYDHINSWARDNSKSYFSPKNDHEWFNPFDSILSVNALIKNQHHASAIILNIYYAMEGLTYGLRRYDDKFSVSLEKLNSLASELQGLCFAAFSSNEVFAKAIVYNQLLEKLYIDHSFTRKDDHKKYADEVVSLLISENLHHDLGPAIKNFTGPELVKMLKLVLKTKLKAYNKKIRLKIALKLVGRRFHYAYQHKKVIGIITTAGWAEGDIAEIKTCLQVCTDLKNEYEEDRKEISNHDLNHGDALYVFGDDEDEENEQA